MIYEPLIVTARISGAISLPWAPIALDGLLMWAVAQRLNLPPLIAGEPAAQLEIPIAREPDGRFHLSSLSEQAVEERELRYINRRFPLEQGQTLGNRKLRRISISAGAQKSYRLPMETQHLVEDRLTWWCVGEREEIAALLAEVHFLGKKRSTGLGQIREWTIEPCAAWPGFPVLRDGAPLRALPPDWPGLAPGVDIQMRVISPPYWDRTREEECAVPRSAS